MENIWVNEFLIDEYLQTLWKVAYRLTDTSGQSSKNKPCSVHCLTIQILPYKFFKLIPFSAT